MASRSSVIDKKKQVRSQLNLLFFLLYITISDLFIKIAKRQDETKKKMLRQKKMKFIQFAFSESFYLLLDYKFFFFFGVVFISHK